MQILIQKRVAHVHNNRQLWICISRHVVLSSFVQIVHERAEERYPLWSLCAHCFYICVYAEKQIDLVRWIWSPVCCDRVNRTQGLQLLPHIILIRHKIHLLLKPNLYGFRSSFEYKILPSLMPQFAWITLRKHAHTHTLTHRHASEGVYEKNGFSKGFVINE